MISYDEIVQKCAEVVCGDAEWPSLIDRACRFVEGEKALFFVSDRNGVLHHSISHRHESDVAARYNDGYNAIDPRLPLALATAAGDARTGQQYLRNEAFNHTEYFNEITLRADVMDSVHGVICDQYNTGRVAISVQRGFGREFFDGKNVDRMRAILPLLKQAVMVSANFDLSAGTDDVMERSCLVDSESNVRFSRTGDVEALEATGIGAVSNGRLLIRRKAVAELFTRAFSRQSIDSPIRFRVASEPPLYSNFKLSEVPPSMSLLIASTRTLMLTYGIAEDVPNGLTEQFAEAYGLTSRERDIIQIVASSGNLRASADELGISYETLRTHMKHVYEKTNFRTVNDVIQAVRTGDLSNLI